MRLGFYILRRYLRFLILVAVFLTSIIFIVDIFDQFGFISRNEGTILQAFLLAVLRIPQKLVEFLPFFILLATLLAMLSLARTSELVFIRAAGISGAKIVLIPVITSGLIGLLLISIANPLLVGSRQISESYSNALRGKQSTLIGQFSSGLWLRDNYFMEERLFHIGNLDVEKRQFQKVDVFVSPPDQMRTRYIAKNMKLEDGLWKLTNVIQIDTQDGLRRTQHDTVELPSNQSFEDFVGLLEAPSKVKNFDFLRYLKNLETDGYDNKSALSYIWQEVFTPFLFMTMSLLGAVFALAPLRGGGQALRVLTALSSGFLVFGMYRLAIALGKSGELPMVISVAAVPIGAMLIFYALLIHQEDG